VITLGLHTGCIGSIFMTGILTLSGEIFDFSNGNSRWPWTLARAIKRIHNTWKNLENLENVSRLLEVIGSTHVWATFLGRPEPPFRTGLCFTRDAFLGSHISEVPRPIAAKLCHMIGIRLKRSRKLQKFGGRPLKNIGGQKHAKFRSIFYTVRLWLRISPERLKVSKSKRDVFYIDSSCVLGNRSRELWSTNFRDFEVRLDPLKWTFWDTISRPSGGAARWNFYTR